MAAGFFVTLCLCVGLCASLAELADGGRHVKRSVLFTPQERQKKRIRIAAAVLAAATVLVIGGYALYRRMKAQSPRRAVELERAALLGGQEEGDSGDPIFRAKLPELGGGKGRRSDGGQVYPQQLQKTASHNIRCRGGSSDGGWTTKKSDDEDDRRHNAIASPYPDGSVDEVDLGPRRDGFGGGPDAAPTDLTTAEALASTVHGKRHFPQRWINKRRGNGFNSFEGSSPMPWRPPPLDEGAGDTPIFPPPIATWESPKRRRK